MKRQSIPLLSPAVGTTRELVAFHFGPAGTERKIYIQASLHADETPAMLTAVLFKRRLEELEADGRLNAEIIVVPVANPVGLGQYFLGQFLGRFDAASGRNFNRHFLQLEKLVGKVGRQFGEDPVANRDRVRTRLREQLDRQAPMTEYESLQLALLKLSCDADVVIDLHCSLEAVMHVYASESAWPEVEPLARYLGADASLLATHAGGQAFDEAHTLLWWDVCRQAADNRPVCPGTVAVTVECRGQRDVSYETAQQDADALIDYLIHRGDISGTAKPLPPLRFPATPLAGSEQFYAPVSGILVHRARVGDRVSVGDPLFDIVDPLTDRVTTVTSHNEGVFYMRRAIRFVTAGAPLGRVTGERSVRTGMLLGA